MKYYSSDEPAWGFLGDECQSQYCDLARGQERHFRTGKRADSLDTTPFRLPVLPFSPTSSGRHFAGFPVAIKTPGIWVNFAVKNEIMLFGIISGIISELISRITWSLPLVYSVYFGKIYCFIYASAERKHNRLANAGSKILGLSTLVIEQGLKQREGCSLIHFFNPVWKLYHESIHQ